ncbi:MAG: DUF2809 domain-containing protein [Lachnospiraceae bacterium]|nr:DUF2809 domain-containing protein [Lachnospiraceae bacterium]
MGLRKKRMAYLLATLLLFGIELLIALFVHDDFIRPYVGDVLVVVLLYTFVRIFIPEKVRWLPLYIFLFAAGVEVLQYVRIAEVLGLSDNRILSVVIGSVFDVKDIVCYGVGCGLLFVYEGVKRGRK